MTTRWKVSKADEYAIQDESGVIANCDSTAIATQIVREHNAHAAMVAVLTKINQAAWPNSCPARLAEEIQAALRLAKGG